MRWTRAGVAAVATALVLAACASRRPDGDGEHRRWPWAEPRDAYIRRSHVWLGEDLDTWVRRMRTLDLRGGPGGIAPDALVECTYQKPDKDEFSGVTPKFMCRTTPGDDEVKVKWGADNAEIYAEVAGTRLLWALGFVADRVDPVRVRCTGCADDPWTDRDPKPGHVATFDPATIEFQVPGRTIQARKHQGWTWRELDGIDPAPGGAPRAHVDALRLLCAFVQHRDSKADNQRLLCPPDAIAQTDQGMTCRRPLMMINDTGSFFGGSRWGVGTYKMDIDAWERYPVWKDARRCIAGITSEWDATDGLDDPQIGEEGRRFLATLLGALDHAQIVALLTAARADRRGGVDRWVAAFEARREQILHPVPSEATFRCPKVARSKDSAAPRR